ncbi:hypothetical protein ACLB2K_073760 [Fragaria x ananassa]
MGSVPSLEQIFQMLAELKSQNLAIQQSIADLIEQVSTTHQIVTNLNEQSKQNRAFLQADQDKKIGSPNEDFNGHVPANQIELSSSQSGDEDSLLDEPTSKEKITLSINDKEPEVDAGEIMDDNHISKFHGVPHE